MFLFWYIYFKVSEDLIFLKDLFSSTSFHFYWFFCELVLLSEFIYLVLLHSYSFNSFVLTSSRWVERERKMPGRMLTSSLSVLQKRISFTCKIRVDLFPLWTATLVSKALFVFSCTFQIIKKLTMMKRDPTLPLLWKIITDISRVVLEDTISPEDGKTVANFSTCFFFGQKPHGLQQGPSTVYWRELTLLGHHDTTQVSWSVSSAEQWWVTIDAFRRHFVPQNDRTFPSRPEKRSTIDTFFLPEFSFLFSISFLRLRVKSSTLLVFLFRGETVDRVLPEDRLRHVQSRRMANGKHWRVIDPAAKDFRFHQTFQLTHFCFIYFIFLSLFFDVTTKVENDST